MKKRPFITLTLTLLLFAAHANAQMVMEWQSPPNMQPGSMRLDPGTDATVGEFRDFDGDGVKDIPIFKNSGGQNALVVISGADPNTTWLFPLPQGIIGILVSFFDVDNSNGSEKEVILATRSNSVQSAREAQAVINQNGLVKQFGNQVLLLGIGDYDKDNDVEMLLADGSVRFLMLWGKGN